MNFISNRVIELPLTKHSIVYQFQVNCTLDPYVINTNVASCRSFIFSHLNRCIYISHFFHPLIDWFTRSNVKIANDHLRLKRKDYVDFLLSNMLSLLTCSSPV